MRLLLLLASCAVLAAAACGANDSTAPPASAVATADATSTTPTTAAAAAVTVQQVASIVARHEPDLRKYLGEIRACRDLSNPECDRLSGVTYLNTKLTLDTFRIELNGIADPSTKLYRGPVPAELRDLYERTVGDTRRAVRGIEGVTDHAQCRPGTPEAAASEGCVRTNNDAHLELRRVEGDLDAWRPYLGG